jgi:hypothetical protein
VRTGDCAAGALVIAEVNCGLLDLPVRSAPASSSKPAGIDVILLNVVGAKRKASSVLTSALIEKPKRHRGVNCRLPFNDKP